MDKIDELGKDEKYIKEGEFDTISEEKDVSDSNEESEMFDNNSKNSSDLSDDAKNKKGKKNIAKNNIKNDKNKKYKTNKEKRNDINNNKDKNSGDKDNFYFSIEDNIKEFIFCDFGFEEKNNKKIYNIDSLPKYQCLNKIKFNNFILNFDKKLYLNESEDINLYDNPREIY